MQKYSGLKRVTVGLLFFLQNFHIEINNVLVSIMPDFIGIALIYIGLFQMRGLNKRITKELPLLAIDFLINTFVFFLNLYISILNTHNKEVNSFLISTYSLLGAIKGILSCLIIYSVFKICTEFCINEHINKKVYSRCSYCMWSYMILFFINVVMSEVILLFPKSFVLYDTLILIPNLYISIQAVLLCVHMHDALINKIRIENTKIPEQIKELMDNCDSEKAHLHLDDL